MITFKSNASGNVIMLDASAAEILGVMGKNPNYTKGVITIEQLPGAINAIKSAMKKDKATHREPVDDDDGDEITDPVYLHQRASPILDLLERSLNKNEPVTWSA